MAVNNGTGLGGILVAGINTAGGVFGQKFAQKQNAALAAQANASLAAQREFNLMQTAQNNKTLMIGGALVVVGLIAYKRLT